MPRCWRSSAICPGVSVDAVVSCGKTSFDEALLFTHRGLSGPAILQISSYWREGHDIVIDMAPGTDVLARLKELRGDHPRQEMATALADILPKRLGADDRGSRRRPGTDRRFLRLRCWRRRPPR